MSRYRAGLSLGSPESRAYDKDFRVSMIQGPGGGAEIGGGGGEGEASRVAPSHEAARSTQPRKKARSIQTQAPSLIGQDHPARPTQWGSSSSRTDQLMGIREGPGQEGSEVGRQASEEADFFCTKLIKTCKEKQTTSAWSRISQPGLE